MTRHFIIHYVSLNLDEMSVRSGRNHETVVTACRCVNVGLFLSGGLRRDVAVTISTGQHQDLWTITFPGMTLRRVSPDERSISFFLLKAQKRLIKMKSGSEKLMDNGIVLKRTTADDLTQLSGKYPIYMACTSSQENYRDIDCTGTFIYVIDENTSPLLSDGSVVRTARPDHPERYILDTNTDCDRHSSR